MPRIVGDKPHRLPKTTADQWGVGCMLPRIRFDLPNGASYTCDTEYLAAEAILNHHRPLWPAVVIGPTALSPELLYAQCSFRYRPGDDNNYKEASGINNFLRTGRLVEFMREYNVASLLVLSQQLAGRFYDLHEPRIEDSLYVVGLHGSIVRYQPKKGFLRRLFG
jgi:hypothetical protein